MWAHRFKRILIFIIILFLINKQVSASTDLTRLNCPDSYDVAEANTTNPNQNLVNFFYSAFDNDAYRAKVDKLVIEGKSSEFSSLISQMMLPFIIIASFYFIFFMIVACCNMFQKTCPPCQSWRRDFVRRPYQKFEMRCVMIFTLIFATAIFIVCIVMFTSFPVFKLQMEYTKCSLFNMLDVTKNGEQTKQWGGFSQLKNQIGNISSLLATASSEVNKNFKGSDGLSNDDWIIDDMEEMKKDNLDLYRNNKDSKLMTPDPTRLQAFPNGPISNLLISSPFIEKSLGPNGTANTMVTDIDQSLRATQVLSKQAFSIQKMGQILVDSSSTIVSNSDSSLKSLAMYQSQLQEVEKQLGVFSEDYFSQLFDWGFYVIEGLTGFILAGCIFILFGVISTHILDILACRTMVNLGWVIYGLMYFGVIALTFIFLSVGSLGFSFCQYFDKMVSNQAEFNRIGEAYSQNPFTKLEACMYGDGNVLSKFNIANQMQTVTNMFTNIQTYYDYENPTSVKYIDKTKSVTKIQTWIDIIGKYQLGIIHDQDPLETTDKNPFYSLNNLNIWAKYHYANGTRNPNCPRDVWVFDKSACIDPNAQPYTPGTTDAESLKITILNDYCLSLNQMFISTNNYLWDQNEFDKRYMQVKYSCPVAQPQILRYGKALVGYRDWRINLFQGINDSLIKLKTKHQQFNANLTSYKGRVDSFYSSVSTLNNLVTDKISGLLVSSDCRVVSDYLKLTNNVFCKNVMGQAAILGICSVLLMGIMIGGLITASVFAVRYSKIQNTEKHSKRIVIPETSIHSQTFERKEQNKSSQSSSSSDED